MRALRLRKVGEESQRSTQHHRQVIERLPSPTSASPDQSQTCICNYRCKRCIPVASHRIIPKAGFEDPVIHQIPETSLGSDSVEMANSKFPTGELVLRTSEGHLVVEGQGGERAALNCIEYLVGHSGGVDRLTELGAL